jgi:hypothetical protein
MTTIITRLYPDVAAAQTVAKALRAEGDQFSSISILTRDGDGTLADRLHDAMVSGGAAAAYSGPMGEGRALLVVNAPFAPMGTALNAIRTVSRFPAINVGLADEDRYIRDEPDVELSGRVFTGRKFFMSNPNMRLPMGHILGSNPIIHSGPRTSAIRGGAYMSTKFWPMKLLSKPKEGTSAIRGTWLFSSIFGIPTLIKRWAPREDVPTII